MSGFVLVPVDGGAPVHLPPGDTVLGRGPLLAVSDRRISRHHALLQNLDGKLRLKSTHLNPCFVQSSLTDDPRPLLKDSWWSLHDGDFFSLLPGQFVYRVAAVGGATDPDTSSRNGHIRKEEKQEEAELHDSPEPAVELSHPIRASSGQTPPHDKSPAAEEEEPSPNRRQTTNQEDRTLKEEVKDEDDDDDDVPSVVRTRVLPAWMIAAKTKPRGSSPKPKVESARRNNSKQATSTEEAELSEEEEEHRPRKKRRKEDKGRATPTTAGDSASTPPTTTAGDSASTPPTTTAGDSASTPPTTTAGDSASTPPTTTRASDISEGQQEVTDRKSKVESASSVPVLSKRPLRTPCPYGRDCYRKNPVHFQECSHPGDTDYEEEEEDEEALDRPECPYGTDCYRKNPLHRKEFKHTKRPARATRTAPQQSPAHDDEEEDDNSFIDDDSEDGGDDEDYVPPDSEDSGKEDIKRLQKEAKVFLQRRK